MLLRPMVKMFPITKMPYGIKRSEESSVTFRLEISNQEILLVVTGLQRKKPTKLLRKLSKTYTGGVS